jgi:uncharacterized protein
MQIEVARIPAEGLELSGDDADVFPAESQTDAFEPLGPVRYDFHANYVSGELIVTGVITADVRFPCSRCAASFNKEVRDGRFSFVSETPDGTESVDLTPDIREAILCAFPSHPMCRNDCKGLCAQCGKDLNEEGCECTPDEMSRWGALDGLKL